MIGARKYAYALNTGVPFRIPVDVPFRITVDGVLCERVSIDGQWATID